MFLDGLRGKLHAGCLSIAWAMIVVMLVLVSPGCAFESGAAATFQGESISEEDVTAYIQSYRQRDSELLDDRAWTLFLSENDSSPESMREDVIAFMAQHLAIMHDAADRGIPIPTQAQIEDEIESRRLAYMRNADYYSGTYSIDSWDDFVLQSYLNEDGLRREVEYDLIKEDYENAVKKDLQVGDEDYQNFLSSFGSFYSTKRLAQIICSSKEKADEALEAVQAGDDWSAVVTAYSVDDDTAAEDGDIGWDILNPGIPSQVAEVVHDLDVGDVSCVVQVDDEDFRIVRCSDKWSASEIENGFEMDKVPSDIIDYLRTRFLEDRFEEYVTQLAMDSALQVAEMPEGLPYDVSIASNAPEEAVQ